MVSLVQVLILLFPLANPQIDYRISLISGALKITYWNPAIGPQPTADQIAAATTQLEAIQAASAQILAAFTALPLGVQAFYAPVLAAVQSAIAAQRWADVRAIISTPPAPSPELVTAQTGILALVNQLLPV